MNEDWLVGCDFSGQVIDANNPNINPATGQPYSELFVPVLSDPSDPNSTPIYGGVTDPVTGITTGGTTVPYFPFACPPTYTSTIDCTDRCGDGIYDGILTFGDFGRSRTTKAYPTGVNGYTPRNPEIGFDYAERMPYEQCDTGKYYAPLADGSEKFKLGYNPEGIGDPTGTHGCNHLCQIEPGWECTVFFYKMLRRSAFKTYTNPARDPLLDFQEGVGVEEPLFRSECWETAPGNDPQTSQPYD